MAMNRETKRRLQRSGDVNAEGDPVRNRPDRNARQAQATRAGSERTKPRQFVREVTAEMRKVAWPTRSETINYSIVVLVALVVLTSFIFGADWVFSQLVLKLFNT